MALAVSLGTKTRGSLPRVDTPLGRVPAALSMLHVSSLALQWPVGYGLGTVWGAILIQLIASHMLPDCASGPGPPMSLEKDKTSVPLEISLKASQATTWCFCEAGGPR